MSLGARENDGRRGRALSLSACALCTRGSRETAPECPFHFICFFLLSVSAQVDTRNWRTLRSNAGRVKFFRLMSRGRRRLCNRALELLIIIKRSDKEQTRLRTRAMKSRYISSRNFIESNECEASRSTWDFWQNARVCFFVADKGIPGIACKSAEERGRKPERERERDSPDARRFSGWRGDRDRRSSSGARALRQSALFPCAARAGRAPLSRLPTARRRALSEEDFFASIFRGRKCHGPIGPCRCLPFVSRRSRYDCASVDGKRSDRQ